MLKRGILLVDNDSDLLAASKSYLERADYGVLVARNADEALRVCREEIIHIAVIDIRLSDDADENDFGGLLLAADLPDHIFKIILTGGRYLNPEDLVREVMEADDQGKVLAAKFLWKKEGPQKVLEAIRTAFRTSVKVKPDLKISLTKAISWRILVNQIRALRDLDESTKVKAEQVLQDLTCRLFHEKSEVRFWQASPGHGHCTVAFVHQIDDGVDGVDLAVKIGPRESIEQEKSRYQKYVIPYVPLCAILQLGPVWSREMGAIAYSFLGEQNQSVRTFGDYYRDERVSNLEIVETLKFLFGESCANWYSGRRKPKDDEMKPLDILHRENLHLLDEKHVAELKVRFNLLLEQKPSGNFLIQLIDDSSFQVQIAERPQPRLPNPLRFALREHGSDADTGNHFFRFPSQVALTHGDLHGGNIIVSGTGRAWLIDFFKTG